jgi:RNA polymerase I-specific transcription initiation factor RRN5
MQEAAKSDSEDVSGRLKDKYIDMDEKVTTTADGWRQHQEYRAPWETYKTPVSVLELLANQKPSSPMPVVYGSRLRNTGSTSGDFSDPSSTIYFRRKQHKSNTEVELHARGTNAYAALRRDNLEGSNVEVEATDTETASVSVGEDTIAQSIEPEGDTVRIDEYEDEMDWT